MFIINFHRVSPLFQDYNLPQALDNLPGVLHSWRPDLQGRQRTESLNLERDVTVLTAYGQVQGFKVHLYDNPLPESGYRPDQTIVETVRGTVSVFLGIPYALPPVGDARFKVCSRSLLFYNLTVRNLDCNSISSHRDHTLAGRLYMQQIMVRYVPSPYSQYSQQTSEA